MTAYKRKEVIGDATLYLGDCLEILPTLDKVDYVITDPPYPGYEYPWPVPNLDVVPFPDVHSFVFWPCLTNFPLEFSARHVWSKCNVCIGDAEPYEEVYELRGKKTCLVFRHAVINCKMNATMNGDTYHAHPTQKPIRLLNRLVKRTKGVVIDPFMGSGTTGVACANLSRKFIGIEIEERYFNIAVERITNAYRQERLFGDSPQSTARPKSALLPGM